jgi:hypothetical protein
MGRGLAGSALVLGAAVTDVYAVTVRTMRTILRISSVLRLPAVTSSIKGWRPSAVASLPIYLAMGSASHVIVEVNDALGPWCLCLLLRHPFLQLHHFHHLSSTVAVMATVPNPSVGESQTLVRSY